MNVAAIRVQLLFQFNCFSTTAVCSNFIINYYLHLEVTMYKTVSTLECQYTWSYVLLYKEVLIIQKITFKM